MKILVACEFSGKVRDAFIAQGHDAMSCDFLPSEGVHRDRHYQGSVLTLMPSKAWDMLIAFPPCTYLCSSGLHWNKRVEGRQAKTDDALKFVSTLLNADIPMIALENPIGCISTQIRKPDQMIQPYEFGDDASKRTCLWLKGLPKLEPTERISGRMVNGKERWSNQTDSGQNKLAPSETRAKERSTTYDGIANAMANQWGKLHPLELIRR
ncbi:MAG: hypothetical protein CL489_17740 [Acidobacteria bacterium]|nr:hypothetical protein [Acidobacteriota bacterium]